MRRSGLLRFPAALASFLCAFCCVQGLADTSTVLNDLGVEKSRQGEFEAAIEHFSRAVQAATSPHERARAAANELRARVANKELALAPSITFAKAAIAQMPDDAPRVRLQLAVASTLHEAGTTSGTSDLRLQAHTLLSAALRTASRLDDPALLAGANGYLGLIYAADGQSESARAYLERATLEAARTGRDEIAYLWDWRLGAFLAEAGELPAARASYARAAEALNRVRNVLLEGGLEVFSRRVQPVYVGYADVLLRLSAGAGNDEARGVLLARSRDVLQDFKQAEVEDYFSNQCVAELSDQPAGADAGTAVLYPVFMPDRVEILAESAAGLRQFSVPVARNRVTATIRAFRRNLQTRALGADYLQQAKLLHSWLMAPLEDWLAETDVHTLIVVPDGPLRTVPFGALHDGDSFVVERYAVAITPSLRYTNNRSTTTTDQMLIGGLSEGVQGFSPLPHVREEVATLADAFPASLYADDEFRVSPMRQAMGNSEFGIVHLATHGEFKSDYRQSFLLTYDDRLTLAQLQETLQTRSLPGAPRGRLDLIVLSACNTAMGDDRAALGLAGVAIQSGADSALASLWPVSDLGTSRLMATFYDSLRAGLGKAESLRRAQRHLIEDDRLAHPAYWAPFTLVGSWQ